MITYYSTALDINPHFREGSIYPTTQPQHKDFKSRRVVLSVGPGVKPHWNPQPH